MSIARALKAERDKATGVHQALEFVARMCWRTDPPNASRSMSEYERFDAIKHHPAIKAAAAPHRELAKSESTAAIRGQP